MNIVIQVGQVFMCKFRGTGNGDAIAVRVIRRGFVDKDGESAVELKDLLTGRSHTKKERVLCQRNWLGTEADALEVQQVNRESGPAEARLWAVALYRVSKSPPPAPEHEAAQ